MKYLVDTHLLIWSAYREAKLSPQAYSLLNNKEVQPYFSSVSLWEVALKRSKNRSDFRYEPGHLHLGLLEAGFMELGLASNHVLAFGSIAPGLSDPFDRLLLAQATVEGAVLLTADKVLGQCSGPIHFVG